MIPLMNMIAEQQGMKENSMDIRLVAIDVDGTLLKTDKTLSSATARAIGRASARGVEVVLSTGRIYVEFAPLLTMLPTIRYAVSCTGASVLDCRSREELFSAPLPLEQARRDYKVGIPCFFPTTGKLSMLLPIAFSARRNAKPCLALVVERLDNGMYVGRTVLTMDMAYKDSRLLCRPSGEWLRPADIVSDGEEEE